MPASCTSGQPSNPRRHSTCWASQRSHTVSSTLCHGAWISAQLSTECECTAPQIETPIVPAPQQLTSSTENSSIRAALWADHRWNADWLHNTTRRGTFIPDIGTHPARIAIPRATYVWLNYPHIGVGCFRSWLYKWGVDPIFNPWDRIGSPKNTLKTLSGECRIDIVTSSSANLIFMRFSSFSQLMSLMHIIMLYSFHALIKPVYFHTFEVLCSALP